MNKKTLIIAVALVAQVAAISWLIWRYECVVSQGVEVRFACQAYDPYDPLRGRYLRTRVSEDCTNMAFQVGETNRYEFRNKLFARLEPNGTNGLWRVAEVAEHPRAEGLWVRPKGSSVEYRIGWSERGKDEKWENFSKRRERSGWKAVVTFPDQLFVNEKLAPEAEKVLRKATGKSAVAVYRVYKGEIVITDIEVEGKSVAEVAGAEARHPETAKREKAK